MDHTFPEGHELDFDQLDGERDNEGWDFTNREWNEVMLKIGEGSNREVGEWLVKDENVSSYIEGAPRLRRDLESLKDSMQPEFPSDILVRGSKLMVVKCGFGDSSYTGFGASWITNSESIKDMRTKN